MTIAIICEYNPFHNGHKYLIDEARRIFGDDTRVIAVMSGNFVQRGEPASFNKWARAEAALLCGADAVVEIPSVFAASSAQYFAEAAVSTVDLLGCAELLVFGSETADLERIAAAAEARLNPTPEFQLKLKEALKAGLSYPAAMQAALGGEALGSNDILGVEYVRAIRMMNSRVKPYAIKRGGNAAHRDVSPCESAEEKATTAPISSARSIRGLFAADPFSQEGIDSIRRFMPEMAFDAQASALQEQGGTILSLCDFEQFIFAQIRIMKSDGLKELPFVTEGLENKIYAECCRTSSLDELIESCVGTRYTRTRITRILVSLLTGARQKHFDQYTSKVIDVPYARVLGIRREAKSLLTEISQACSANGKDFIAGNIPAGLAGLSTRSAELLTLEATATDLYYLACPNKKADCEYRKPLIIV